MKQRAWGVVAAVLALVGCVANEPASEGEAASESDLVAQKRSMLALGDSMAFAWDPTVATDEGGHVIASRYRGYPDLVGQRLGLRVVNASCPGETSAGFVSKNGEDNGCRTNRASYALHTDWAGAETQLDYVVGYLQKSVAAGTAPELITLSIGGNDLLLVKQGCGQWGPIGAACKFARLPFIEHGFGENLEKILRAIDGTGFRGTMVLLTTYALDYGDKIATFALGRINGELQESLDHVQQDLQMKVRIADGYAAFKTNADAHNGKTCETGLLIKNAAGGGDHVDDCDIHPSAAGHDALADAIIAAAR